jgi:hypothetical protein
MVNMAILFTQEWDIVRGQEDTYEQFISQEFIPRSEKLGLRAVGGYYVEVGVGPRVVSVRSTESLEELYTILALKEFFRLQSQLKEHVANYRSKVLYPTGRVKSEKYEIQKGVWKFNQYWNQRPGKRDQYADFMATEYLPMLNGLDYLELTGGWIVIMGGEREIVGELTFKSPIDIGRLLENPDFRQLTEELRRNYVSNYTTRILRTTERFDEPRWYRL